MANPFHSLTRAWVLLLFAFAACSRPLAVDTPANFRSKLIIIESRADGVQAWAVEQESEGKSAFTIRDDAIAVALLGFECALDDYGIEPGEVEVKLAEPSWAPDFRPLPPYTISQPADELPEFSPERLRSIQVAATDWWTAIQEREIRRGLVRELLGTLPLSVVPFGDGIVLAWPYSVHLRHIRPGQDSNDLWSSPVGSEFLSGLAPYASLSPKILVATEAESGAPTPRAYVVSSTGASALDGPAVGERAFRPRSLYASGDDTHPRTALAIGTGIDGRLVEEETRTYVGSTWVALMEGRRWTRFNLPEEPYVGGEVTAARFGEAWRLAFAGSGAQYELTETGPVSLDDGADAVAGSGPSLWTFTPAGEVILQTETTETRRFGGPPFRPRYLDAGKGTVLLAADSARAVTYNHAVPCGKPGVWESDARIAGVAQVPSGAGGTAAVVLDLGDNQGSVVWLSIQQ